MRSGTNFYSKSIKHVRTDAQRNFKVASRLKKIYYMYITLLNYTKL